MCVRTSARTSAIDRPACSSSRRSVGSVLDGPGSMSATPPGPCTTAVAMMRGTPWKWRSTYDKPDASVIMMTSGLRRHLLLGHAPRAHDGEHRERRDDDEGDEAAAPNQAFEPVPALAESVPEEPDRRRPDDRAGGVVEQERRPAQMARAREHRAKHAQPGDEARDEHGLRAVACEEPVELFEPGLRQANPPSMPLDETAPEAPSDEEPEVVAENRGGDRRDDDPREREAAVMRKRCAREQRCLPRNGQAGILQKHADEHDGVPVAREEID